MNTRHKWADVIIAFAEGKRVQFKSRGWADWRDWCGQLCPEFDPSVDWRIKPAEPVVKYLWTQDAKSSAVFCLTEEAALQMGYRFKIEGTRTEFPNE